MKMQADPVSGNGRGGWRSLAQLGKGEWGRVVEIHGDSDTVTRLHALGFLRGCEVRHRNTAPLGDPVAYEFNGQKVSLRRAEARLVQIEERGL